MNGRRGFRTRRLRLFLPSCSRRARGHCRSDRHAGEREHDARTDDDARTDVVHYLSAATLLGGVPSSQQVTVGVVLNNPNQAAEDTYLAQLYDPSSANYQQFLDPDQFNAQFGVPATTVSTATSWLTGGGLSVSQPEGATTYLQANRHRSTGVGALRYAAEQLLGRRTHVLCECARTDGSGGVADRDRARAEQLRVLRHTASQCVRPADVLDGAGERCAGDRAPRSEDAVVDLTTRRGRTLGNGQTMAILGWGVTDGVESDLRSFEQENQLPQPPLTTKYYGSTITPDTVDGATIEWGARHAGVDRHGTECAR